MKVDIFDTEKRYKIIYADPPWKYGDRNCHGAADQHYKCMKLSEIEALPVSRIADKDCVLFLWTTYPMMQEAMKLIAFQWIKTYPKSTDKFFFGLGRWTRGNTEPCLIAIKGKPKRESNSVSQLIISPLKRHSQKPEETREKIIELMGDLPRIELFARQQSGGWDCWGDEV